MEENSIGHDEAELVELDDVLDHAFFSDEKESLDSDEEMFFISDGSNDFRHLDEL